jgi:signal transduction histidine kinase
VNEDWWLARSSGLVSSWLAVLICAGIAALGWFGYRAADEWQRSSALLVDRRADEVANTLTTALTRDMRAVQTSVLDGREWSTTSSTPPYDVIDVVAGAFARYPYPEVFFGWQADGSGVFFARSERLPDWLSSGGSGRQYPVEVLRSLPVAQRLFGRIHPDVVKERHHSVFEVEIGGSAYQVIARPMYVNSNGRNTSAGGFAVLVNLDWARRNYFASISRQVARIAGAGDAMVFTILDEEGTPLPGLPMPLARDPVKRRPFPVTFFDPMLTALNPPRDLVQRTWTIQVSAGNDPTLALAASGARRTLVVIAAGAIAMALGLLVMTRAARAMATISAMRSDFVSAVTHELKTPVQVIRSIGETLYRGRVSTGERLHEYAQLLVQEEHRLSRLIDNLLAYSRVTDVAQLYSFEPHQPNDIVCEALRGFHRLVADRGFQVRVDMPETLPMVNADRTSITLAFENLIDNAMRYSGDARDIEIVGHAGGESVDIAIRDHGVGIAADELERVQRRFSRGRSAQGHGSGLGLAIVSRIVADHSGAFRLESTRDVGTVATVTLPIVGG